MSWLGDHRDEKWGQTEKEFKPAIFYLLYLFPGRLKSYWLSPMTETRFLPTRSPGSTKIQRKASCISSPDHTTTKLSEQLWQYHACSTVWWKSHREPSLFHIPLERPVLEISARKYFLLWISLISCLKAANWNKQDLQQVSLLCALEKVLCNGKSQ